jgi:uncharacterized protein YidB (DUF937 family)
MKLKGSRHFGEGEEMGIFDSLKGLAGGNANTAIGGVGGKDLSSMVNGLIGQGGAQLPALLEKFHAGGLGNAAESWVGKGANLPINGQQVKSALGSDAISGIAAKLGVSSDQAASKVAAVLPQIIDKLTPDGVVPDPQALSQKLTGLLKR